MHTLPILMLLKHILSHSSSTLFPLLTPSNFKSVYDQSKGFLKPSLKIIIFLLCTFWIVRSDHSFDFHSVFYRHFLLFPPAYNQSLVSISEQLVVLAAALFLLDARRPLEILFSMLFPKPMIFCIGLSSAGCCFFFDKASRHI